RPLAQQRGRQRRNALSPGRLELVVAAKEGDRKRDERKIVLLGNDQVRAVGEDAFGPGWHLQNRRWSRRRDFFVVEPLLRRCRERQTETDGKSNARPHLPPSGFFSS